MGSYSKAIRAASLYGFSGYCGIIALAINKAIFDNKGELVAATNIYVEKLRNGHPFLGHIAVRHHNRYYDAEGEIDYEDLRAWGMVDSEDPVYSCSNPEGDSNAVWLTDDQATDAIVVPLTIYGFDPVKLISHYTGILETWEQVGEDIPVCPTYKMALKQLRKAKRKFI